MRSFNQLTVDLRVPMGIAAVATVVLSLLRAAGQLTALEGGHFVTLGAFFLAVALGETARIQIQTGREVAPMATAAALALAFTSMPLAGGQQATAGLVIATIVAGMAAARIFQRLSGGTPHWADTAARVLGIAVAPVAYRFIELNGRTLVQWQVVWDHRRWLVGLIMLVVGGIAMLIELALEAAVRAGRSQAPILPTLVDEVGSNWALATALVTSGALIALADYAIGLAALPLFLFPLVLTYFAVQRYAGIRTTYRQTIAALSSLTDRAGYTVPEHAQRVATLAVAVGRDLGMGQRDLTDLEYAALLHDLGQVALREPIPDGATVMAAPADQQRIAHDGAEIVRTTGVLDQVAEILEAQTTPYRQVREFGQDLPVSSRIIKVANAYDDMSGPKGENDERAMERIHLGLGYEYDPRVVDSLSRVLERRRRGGASASPA